MVKDSRADQGSSFTAFPATTSRKGHFKEDRWSLCSSSSQPPPKITNHKLLAPLQDFKRQTAEQAGLVKDSQVSVISSFTVLLKIHKNTPYKQRSHFWVCLEKWEPARFFWEFGVRTLQKQCPDVLKNSICSFFGGKRVTKGGRDILLKMEKVIGFSWLAHHPPLLADHAGAPEAGDGWDQGLGPQS